MKLRPVTLSATATRNAVGWCSFLILLATYWITTPRSVSYWDCPEYVSAAYLLEVGHPPGNPLWMIVERIVTMLAPTPQLAAYAVNLSSGVFTAIAGALLAVSLFPVTLWLLRCKRARNLNPTPAAAAVSLTAALAFGWCDSTWYSAVEAEVYAMSICFTALTVWLMVQWAFMHDRLRANRYLVLLAYVFGLSLGVHQLNLLAIPALALVWGLRRGIRNVWKLIAVVLLGMLAVGMALVGMMPGSIALAADIELWTVNRLGLPMLSGVVLYLLLLGASLLLALTVSARSHNRMAVGAALFPALFMSCVFAVRSNFIISAVISALAAALLVRRSIFDRRRLNLAVWMLTMLMTGYGAYALIPVRGHIPSPANAGMPGEPFAFAAYQAREQYGGAPLLYGNTPYSKPLYQEEWVDGEDLPLYRRYAMHRTHRLVAPYMEGARITSMGQELESADSILNDKVTHNGTGYMVYGYGLKNIYTPELDCWFPRISSRDVRDLQSYADWAGMDTTTMTRVPVSIALDTLGRPVSRMSRPGVRDTIYSYRPTALQNLQMLGAYQIGYMYLRYLMWNFAGRQNDIPSQGEVEHGNFITGITAVDNLMLGAEDSLPAEAGSGNPGRNRYWGLPLLLGLAGLIWLIAEGRRGRAVAVITGLLFVMTGIAIVVYLNQSPGEPRERDYSFIGSFWVFAIWIGFGALWLARLLRTPWSFLLTLLVPMWMCMENFDDHDRRGREAAASIARSVLRSLEPDAILFVDGDNYTFPLWYAQEVEGVRRDVRVLNVSYLSIGRYAANAMLPWRESAPVPATLTRGDVMYNGMRSVRVPTAKDTLPALTLLKMLHDTPAGKRPELAARYALIQASPGRSVVMDMRRPGNGELRLPDLMMFDIMVTSAARELPRPVYWLNTQPFPSRTGIDMKWFDKGLFATRFGVVDEERSLDSLAAAVGRVTPPNATDRNVYLDATPGRMTGHLREALTLAARRQLDAGRLTDALRSLRKADEMLGESFNSYVFMVDGDSVVGVRHEMGRLQMALADSLTGRYDDERIRNIADRLHARGEYNIRMAERRLALWKRYRHALPDRLKGVTVPLN